MWKLAFSLSVVAGTIATGQVTSERFTYPFQKGRGVPYPFSSRWRERGLARATFLDLPIWFAGD
jgi:hypothetical protein